MHGGVPPRTGSHCPELSEVLGAAIRLGDYPDHIHRVQFDLWGILSVI